MKTISISQWVAAAVKTLARGTVRGAHAPSRVAEDALVLSSERHDVEPRTIFREGAKNEHARARVLPALCAFAFLFAASALAQVTNLNLGNLAPGETVTVTYEVTINNVLPPTLQGITNQAAVSGTGITTVNSDDPDTGALNDPTV